MSKKEYEAFTEEVFQHKQRVSQANTELTINRAQRAEAEAERTAAVLAGDTEKEKAARQRCEELDTKLKYMQKDVEIMASRNGIRHNPKVMAAGSAVIKVNSKEMQTLQNRWEHVAEQLNEHKAAYLALVCELGRIEKMALRLRAQNDDILQTTGQQGAWMSTPGDRTVNLMKNTGLIFMPERELVERYKFPDKFKSKEA